MKSTLLGHSPIPSLALLTAAALALSPAGGPAQTTNTPRRELTQSLTTNTASPAELALSTNAPAVAASISLPNHVAVRAPAISGLTSGGAAGTSQLQSASGGGLALGSTQVTSHLLNINFGWGTEKVGVAAIGQSATDFWNWCNTDYQDPFYMTDLAWSDGSNSGATLEVDNGPGLWGNGSADPMYDSYIYSWDGGDVNVRLNGLPAGTYDVYVYGHGPAENANSVVELWVNGTDFGQKGTTMWGPGWSTTDWEESQQYVVYRNVNVTNGDTIHLDVQPGASGFTIVNGMQVVSSDAISHAPPATYKLIDVDFGGPLQKTGFAAVGVTPNDTWNWYDGTYYDLPSGSMAPLVWSDGSSSSAGLLLTNGPGFWGMSAGDNMYDSYVYPRSFSGHTGVTLTNLSTGGLTADFYVYAHAGSTDDNAVISLTTAGTTYGPRGTTIWGTAWSTNQWEEGAQYVVFRNVPISTNQPIYIDVAPGLAGYPKINGLQIAVPLDRDNNGLPDWWEMQYFGHTGVDPSADPDRDGLTNWEEYKLGLDPLDADTGGTGIPDGDKDTDHDGLSNLAELRIYHSCPWNAHTFSPNADDGQYLLSALGIDKPPPGEPCPCGAPPPGQPCQCDSLANLYITYPPGSDQVQLEIKNAPPGSVYDLWFLDQLSIPITQAPWRPIYPGIQCDNSGRATVTLDEPTYPTGFFIIFDAADDDGDGLSNGYECWFTYGPAHNKSCAQSKYSAGDSIDDGWRVEYGFDPTNPNGQGAMDANPDGDLDPADGSPLTNYKEYQQYTALTGQYDPLKPYGTSQDRPIMTVVADNASPTCEAASFTFYRYGPLGTAQTVYYALGRDLRYDIDYNLSPLPQLLPGQPGYPDGYPRVFVATMDQRAQSVTVQVNLIGHPVTPGQKKNLVVAVTPYPGAPPNAVPNPLQWAYVVDRPTHLDHTTITFDSQKLLPQALNASGSTCPAIPVDIALTGQNNCGASLTFSVVIPPNPAHGTLSPITQTGPTTATVRYTPSSNPRFCGIDTFTFKVSDALGDSTPATVTVTVGDLSPDAQCRDVVTPMNQSVTFNLAGTDHCGEPLTYAIEIYPNPSKGNITQFNQTTGSVTYQPAPGFVGDDSFVFSVHTCASGTAYQTIYLYAVSPLPVLATSCRPDGILLHWSAPSQGIAPGFFYDFRIYRCDNGPGCTPTLLTSVPGTTRTYLDSSNLQPGHTYCYLLTFRHQNPNCNPADIYESPPSNLSCSQLCSATTVWITGNRADAGDGTAPIETYDFVTGTRLNSFQPQASRNGRGLAIRAGEIFYTERWDFDVHVCAYGTAGSGATTDTRVLHNKWRSEVEIQDLAFHGGLLYLLTGYPSQDLQVFALDPTTGTKLAGPIQIPVFPNSPAHPDSDAFAVLPWGNFLINDGDGAGGVTTYHEYDGANGTLVPTGLVIDLSTFGFANCTGVALAPDGLSLYFLADIDLGGGQTLVHTDLSGNLIGFQPVSATALEDIDVVAP